ncbi:MAG: gliding motility-associated C-terminal domain-containing protein [Bacteroidia bacterium]
MSIKNILLIVLLSVITLNASATKRYWTGRGANKNWNNTSNWGATSNSSTSASVPTSSSTDTAYFDGAATGKRCNMEVNISVKFLQISGDTLTQNGFVMTLGTSGMVVSGGVFTGGSSTITDGGLLTVSGGSFTGTSGQMTVTGNYTFSGGTFTHNNGETKFNGTTQSATGSTTFYKLTLANVTLNIASGTILTVSNMLTHGNTLVNTGAIYAKGNIQLNGTNNTGGGSGTITINGSGSQTFFGHTSYTGRLTGWTPNIVVSKSSSDTLFLKDWITVKGNFTDSSGVLNSTTYHQSLCFPSGINNTIYGKFTVDTLLVYASGATTNNMAVNTGDTVTVTNGLNLQGIAAVILSGVYKVLGDVRITNTLTTSGGTGTIYIAGTGSQTILGSTTASQGKLCNVKINKPTGTLTLKNYVNMAGDWIYQAGTIDASTNSSTVLFSTNTAGRTISGKHSLYNVTFDAPGNNINNLGATDTLTVAGTLTYSGTNPITLNTGVVRPLGNITITNTYASTTTGGTATLNINGTGSQTLQGAANMAEGRLCNVKINKPGGTLRLENYINMGGDWTYVTGGLDASSDSSTVVFASSSGRTISGKHTLYNVTFYGISGGGSTNTINATDTLTIAGTLKTEGTNLYEINTGVMKVTGNIEENSTFNSSSVTGGTATVYITGGGYQTITGANASGKGRIPNIKINKSGGTLTLKNIVNAGGDWIYVQGNVDVSTYNSTVCFPFNTGRTISGKPIFNGLTFFGAATCANTLSDTVTVNGELRYEGTAAITITGGTIRAKGDITITNTITAQGGGTGWLHICGTGTQNFTGNGVALSCLLSNVKIDKATTNPLNLYSYISIATGATWKYVQGNVNPGTSVFTAGGGATIDAGTMHFNEFRIQGGTTSTLSSNLYVDGLLYIQAARGLTSNSHDIYLGGSWDNNGTFTGGTSKITFNGSGGQYLLHPASTVGFYDVEVNKPSGKLYTSAAILSVTHSLTMTKGVIGATYSKYVTLSNGATCTGGSDSSYVRGSFRKTGNAAFTFPLGDTILSTNPYHPLSITAPSVTTDVFAARYVDSVQANGSTTDTTIINLSNCEKWNLTRNAGTSTVSVTLGWNTNSYSIISAADARIAYWNSGTSTWNDKGGTASTGTGSVGTTKTSAVQSSFGDFTFALAKETQKYFRSTATGNWEAPGTWQNSYDNSTWVSSNVTPYYGSNAINVQSSHTVTINENVKTDQTTVDGTLIYGNTAGSTLTINDGTGTDLTINGTFKEDGPNDLVWLSSASWLMGSSGTLVRTNSTSSDKWRDTYSGGISTIPSTSNWIVRKTGTPSPLLSSSGGMYYGNLTIENLTGSAWTTTGNSRFTGSSDFPRIKGNLTIGGGGGSAVTLVDTNTNVTRIPVVGNLTINSGCSFQVNGTGITLKGNLIATGSITGSPNFNLNGTSNQTISGASITGMYDMTVNKTSGKVFLNTRLKIVRTLTLTKGIIYIGSSSDTLIFADGGVHSGASDSSYVSGLIKKIGNDAFTFPLGDTTLSTASYHPLSITAPSGISDEFSAKYFASDVLSAYPTYTAYLTDSIVSISGCEYWLLNRTAGSSVVTPSLAWNANTCAYNNGNLRPAGWNGTRWVPLGASQYVENISPGTLAGNSGYSTSALLLVIAKDAHLQTTGVITDVNCSTSAPGSITLTPTGGVTPYTYLWSNGSTSQNQSSLTAGVYNVTITDHASHVFIKQFRVYKCAKWTDADSVTVSGETLTKTGISGWDHSAIKTQNLLYENAIGALKYKVENVSKKVTIGFSDETKSNAALASTLFAVRLDAGTATTYVNGSSSGSTGILLNDVLELVRTDSTLTFIKNGISINTTSLANQNALKGDVMPYTQGQSVTGVMATFKLPEFVVNTNLLKDTVMGQDSIAVEVLRDSVLVSDTITPAVITSAVPSAFTGNATYDIKLSKSTLTETKIQCVTTKYGAVQSVSFYNDTTYVPLDTAFYRVNQKRELVIVPVNTSPVNLHPPTVYLDLEGGIVLSPNGDSNHDVLSLHGSSSVTTFTMSIYDLENNLIYTTTNKNFSWDGKDLDSVLVKGTYVYDMTIDGNQTSGSFLIDF